MNNDSVADCTEESMEVGRKQDGRNMKMDSLDRIRLPRRPTLRVAGGLSVQWSQMSGHTLTRAALSRLMRSVGRGRGRLNVPLADKRSEVEGRSEERAACPR